MIAITKLLCCGDYSGDSLRYIHSSSLQTDGTTKGRGPVVVWNCTKTCNLSCKHCYSNSDSKKYNGELTTNQAKKMIDGLAKFNVPVLLISGGEPLIREDIFEIIKYTGKYNIRSTISTNGTLIDKNIAKELKAHNVGYVGISIDGIGESHDEFRGSKGSFERAINGIRNCLEVGQKVGLRFTISKDNYNQMDDVFYLIKEEKIPRVCFYHLVYSGRGAEMIDEDISHEQTREVMNLIARKAEELGTSTEILTVDNHADGIYLYLKFLKEDPTRAEHILKLLKMSGGNRSGIAIANIDYQGFVHPDQFTTQHVLGNVKERVFGDIWTDRQNLIMDGLKERKLLLKGRCSSCNWKDICNGNFRSRAEAVTGDFWESDPACYLTDEEISIDLN